MGHLCEFMWSLFIGIYNRQGYIYWFMKAAISVVPDRVSQNTKQQKDFAVADPEICPGGAMTRETCGPTRRPSFF